MTSYEARVLHDECAACDVCAAQAVLQAEATREQSGWAEQRDVPEGKIFPQLLHAARVSAAEEDWKLVPAHWGCEDCESIAEGAKSVSVERESPWGFRTISDAGTGESHSMKAIRVL